MIRTDGRPTICTPGVVSAALAEADRRDAELRAVLDGTFRPGGPSVREMVDGLGRGTRCTCGDPGDCATCTA